MSRDKSKKLQALSAVILVFALVLGTGSFQMLTYAYTAKAASISCTSDSTVNLRESATTSSKSLGKLKNGTPLTVIDETTGSDGYTWYKVEYNASGATITGYVRGDLVSISGETSTSTQSGTIDGIYVNVRNAAGTSNTQILCTVNTGHELQVIGQTTVDGNVWYNVTLSANGNNYTGWVYGDYVKIDSETPQADGDYVTQLINAGFPSSYATPLAQLHAKYPNWTFEAVQTGLDWNTVIEKESIIGRNLINNSYDDSRKSTASGAYNWYTNKWAAYDGTSWVAANSDYIAYCMDPRNYLSETYIFMFENLGYSETQNLDGVKSIISNTFMANDVTDSDGKNLNYAQAFVNIGKEKSVSPYHLASRVRQEQGTAGNSDLISGKYPGYEGYYNYFNIGAFKTSSGSIAQNGLAYAKKNGWNSRYKSIQAGADLLASSYIAKGQNTIYFEKFNVVNTSALYSHQYMTNVMAAMSEAKTSASGYTDKQQAFNFRIPVYQNMPDTAVGFTDKGNPNNYLKSLSVSGLALPPGFDGSRTSYSIVADAGVNQTTISASPVAGTSSVSGTGTVNLNTGNNTFEVKCTSESGDVKTYTIKIYRQASSGGSSTPAGSGSGSVSSDKYRIGSYITGVEPGTSASAFLGNIKTSGCTVKVLKADGSENTGTVGTGNKLAVYKDNTMTGSYDIVIYGDANGDGKISFMDLVKLNRHRYNIDKLTGAYLEAGDANRKNDGISFMDMVAINNHYHGKKQIVQ